MSIPESNSFFETTEESNNFLITHNSHDFEQRDGIHKHPLHMNQSNNSLMNNMQSHSLSQPSSTLNLSQGIYIPNSSNPLSNNNQQQMMNMHENINRNVQSKSKVNIPQINSNMNTLNDDIFPNIANYGNLSDNRD